MLQLVERSKVAECPTFHGQGCTRPSGFADACYGGKKLRKKGRGLRKKGTLVFSSLNELELFLLKLFSEKKHMLNLTSKEYPVHTRRSNSDVCTKSKQRRVSTEKWLGVLPKEILMEMNYTQWLNIQHPHCVKVLEAASTKNTTYMMKTQISWQKQPPEWFYKKRCSQKYLNVLLLFKSYLNWWCCSNVLKIRKNKDNYQKQIKHNKTRYIRYI